MSSHSRDEGGHVIHIIRTAAVLSLLALTGCATTTTANAPAAAPTAAAPPAASFAKAGFVAEVKDGRLWVFRDGSKDLEEFRQHGELTKMVTRIGAGPNGMTIRAGDAQDMTTTLRRDSGSSMSMTIAPRIAVENLTKRFPGKSTLALDRVSATIHARAVRGGDRTVGRGQDDAAPLSGVRDAGVERPHPGRRRPTWRRCAAARCARIAHGSG